MLTHPPHPQALKWIEEGIPKDPFLNPRPDEEQPVGGEGCEMRHPVRPRSPDSCLPVKWAFCKVSFIKTLRECWCFCTHFLGEKSNT